MTCMVCGRPKADYEHFTGKMVCKNCITFFKACTECGRLFDPNDYENGVQDSGLCKNCENMKED